MCVVVVVVVVLVVVAAAAAAAITTAAATRKRNFSVSIISVDIMLKSTFSGFVLKKRSDFFISAVLKRNLFYKPGNRFKLCSVRFMHCERTLSSGIS